MLIPQILSGMGVNAYFPSSCLRLLLLISLHLATDCIPLLWDTGGSGTPQQTGAIEDKDGSLDSHKSWTGNRELVKRKPPGSPFRVTETTFNTTLKGIYTKIK